MTKEQIKHMVDRFLGWKLPEDFHPDAGISFKPTFNDHLPQPMKHEPSGTNLFDAAQSDAMVRYLVEGMPDAPGLAWPLSEWHEDIGPVVWWRLCRDERLDEACWIGTPLDDDWPGYHTHWTPHPPIPHFT